MMPDDNSYYERYALEQFRSALEDAIKEFETTADWAKNSGVISGYSVSVVWA